MPHPTVVIPISVKQEHIDFGMERSCRKCPIALAIMEQVKEIGASKVFDVNVALDSTQLLFLRYPWMHECLLPCKAKDFIRAYDRGDLCAPFTFDLTVYL